MESRIQILKSKLVAPYSSETIKRERLYPLLSEILRKRLTTVIAGAGFGKTTLIAEVIDHFKFNAVWYRLDRSDKDFTTFLSYITAGIQKYSPDFGRETFKRIEKSKATNREYEAICTVFLGEIEEYINADLIIVIDDYHFSSDSSEINELLEFLIENLPQQLHLILISRVDPGLHLSRFRARREVLDIREEDIIFSVPEVEELFSQVFDISLEVESLQSLHHKTNGWVSGLILFYHSIKGKGEDEIAELLLKLKGSHRNISSYLEENVYEIQSQEIKDFLIKTSILSRLNASFCDQLLKTENSMQILESLEGNHLFTFSLSEDRDLYKSDLKPRAQNKKFSLQGNSEREWYAYHQLFHDFLQNKLAQELDKSTILKLHKEAAELWEETGNSEEALSHYFKAEQYDKASLLLGNWGLNKLKVEGRFQLISSYLKEIPVNYISKEPWMQYLQAHVYQLSGRLEEAIQHYNNALKIFRRNNQADGQAMCQKSLVFSYLIYGDHRKAENILKDLPGQFKDFPQTAVDILGVLAFLSAHQLKMSAAKSYFDRGLKIAEGLDNKKALSGFYSYQSFWYCVLGDFDKAMKIGETLEEISDDIGDYHLLAMNYLLFSYAHYYLGNYKLGLEKAKIGIDIIREKGLQDHYHGALLMLCGLNASSLGLTTEALGYAKECQRIFKKIGSRWGLAHAYCLLFDVYQRSGKKSDAEQSVMSGLETIKGLPLPMEEGLLKKNMALSLIDNRHFSRAKPFLDDAENLLKKSKQWLTQVYLVYSRFFLEQKQKEAAVEKLLSVLQLSKTYNYHVWIINEKSWILPLLVEILVQGKQKDYIRDLFSRIGIEAVDELKKLQKSKNSKIKKAVTELINELNEIVLNTPQSLKVRFLGKFRVIRGEEEISTEKWKSKKAKMLFKYLVHTREKGFQSRDVFMELLWPDENPEKSVNRLHDALYSLRKIIEPNPKSGSTSYLIRERDTYKITLGDEGELDADSLREELGAAKKEKDPDLANERYLKAEEYYQGDFLEEDVYVEWCVEERTIIKEEYLDLLINVMEYYAKKGDFVKSIEYGEKYLKAEKYTENVYFQLMRFYHNIGNKIMVAKTYEKCKESMKKLEMPLSSEIEDYYQSLSAG